MVVYQLALEMRDVIVKHAFEVSLRLILNKRILTDNFQSEEQWAFKLVRLITLGKFKLLIMSYLMLIMLLGDEKMNSFCYVVDAAIHSGDPIPGLENPTYAEAFSLINCSIPT